MGEKILYICISDESFGKRMLRYISARADASIVAKLITDINELAAGEYEDDLCSDRYLLTDDNTYLSDDYLSDIKVILLSDRDDIKSGYISYTLPAKDIYKRLLSYMNKTDIADDEADKRGIKKHDITDEDNSYSTSLRDRIRKEVIDKIPPGEELSDDKLIYMIEEQIDSTDDVDYISPDVKGRIRHEVFNSLRRMDVLQDILDDESVTEIMVNGKSHIFIEREGKMSELDMSFSAQERLEDIVQQIASGGNRIVNESHPILDVRLADGSRVNIVVPPVAIEGPVITIRKFPKEAMTMQNLIDIGAITEEAKEFLSKLVRAKYNIFISGDNDIIGLSQVTSRTEKATAA